MAPGEPVRVGLWTTDSAPASNAGTRDPVPDGVIMRTPPASGAAASSASQTFPPTRRARTPPRICAGAVARPRPTAPPGIPGFHATDTVDYAICLEGEVWAVLDEDETLMRPGDVLIQRGTYHAWSNRSDRVCRMAFVLIDAEPLDNH